MEKTSWEIERKEGGTLLVRVHSKSENGTKLPDAVFTFRPGDPQYDDWLQKAQQQEQG